MPGEEAPTCQPDTFSQARENVLSFSLAGVLLTGNFLALLTVYSFFSSKFVRSAYALIKKENIVLSNLSNKRE
ncbi:MAG: hypothetical protein ACLUHA_11455 [Bacteroides stercoris]